MTPTKGELWRRNPVIVDPFVFEPPAATYEYATAYLSSNAYLGGVLEFDPRVFATANIASMAYLTGRTGFNSVVNILPKELSTFAYGLQPLDDHGVRWYSHKGTAPGIFSDTVAVTFRNYVDLIWDPSPHNYLDGIEVKPNTTYTLQALFWTLGSGDGSMEWYVVTMAYVNGQATNLTTHKSSREFKIYYQEWTRIHLTFTTGPNTNYIYNIFPLEYTNQTIKMDYVMLSESNVAQDWSLGIGHWGIRRWWHAHMTAKADVKFRLHLWGNLLPYPKSMCDSGILHTNGGPSTQHVWNEPSSFKAVGAGGYNPYRAWLQWSVPQPKYEYPYYDTHPYPSFVHTAYLYSEVGTTAQATYKWGTFSRTGLVTTIPAGVWTRIYVHVPGSLRWTNSGDVKINVLTGAYLNPIWVDGAAMHEVSAEWAPGDPLPDWTPGIG